MKTTIDGLPLCPKCHRRMITIRTGLTHRYFCQCPVQHWTGSEELTEAEAIAAFLAAVRPETQQPKEKKP